MKNNNKKQNIFMSILLILLALGMIFFGGKLVAQYLGTAKKTESTEQNQTTEKTNENNNSEKNSNTPKDNNGTTGETGSKKDPEPVKDPEPDKFGEIRVKAVGDILYHNPLLFHAKKSGSNGKYDFTDQYDLIRDFISDADYTVGNFEGTSHPDRELGGYPMFNSPKEIFPALKAAGFDGLTTINNHALDSRFEGVATTIDAIKEVGLTNFGTQKTPEDKIKLIDVNGVKLCILAYTDNLNGMDFVLDTEEKKKSVNQLDPDTVQQDIKTAREQGADAIIMYPHWGDEYTDKPRPAYVDLARKMIDWGADAVLGNHPHVVQPSEWYTSTDGRKGFILYSIGNFISNQTIETMNDIRTEHSVVIELTFSKNFTKNTSELKDVQLHPTWMKRTYDKYGGYLHQPVIAKDYMKGGSKSKDLNNDQIKRATKAFEMTTKTLNSSVQ